MKKIVEQNVAAVIGINGITNNHHVGFANKKHRYMVVAQIKEVVNNEAWYVYLKQSPSLVVSRTPYNSKRDVLKNNRYTEAFVFNTREELVNWFLNK